MLKDQKRAADRSAHYHFLARTRIMQGYFGAAKFYQHEAARWHERACELREKCKPLYIQQFGRGLRSVRPITLREFSTGLDIAPQRDRTVISVRGNCGVVHPSFAAWRKCKACETPSPIILAVNNG